MTTTEIFPHPLSVHSYLLRVRGSVGMYMESGVLDLLNIAPLNPDTYKPADLHYDSTLSAYWTSDDALMGTIKVSQTSVTYDPRDEGKSLATGCDEDDLTNRVTMIDFLFSGDVKEATSNSNVFCPDTLTIITKKRTQAFFPASAFNSKMRLFIQSIYGSKRDYSMNFSAGLLGGLDIDGEIFNPYTGNRILYTASGYEYYLIDLSSSVRVNKLELSKRGELLRDWLIDNPQSDTEQRRYEAYLLSTATFGDWHTVGSISISGGPIAYSWKTKWDGSEAHQVARKLKSGTTNVWEFTHYKVNISLGDGDWRESSSWTFDDSAVEATQEATFRVTGDLIWTPDIFAGGMQLFVSQEKGDTPTHVDSDVPIYVVYDYANDEFDVVRYKREDLGNGDSAFGGEPWSTTPAISRVNGDGCGDGGCRYRSKADSAISAGFYVSGNDSFTGVGKSGDGVQVQGCEFRLGGEAFEIETTKSGSSPPTLCDSYPGTYDYRIGVAYSASGGTASLSGSFTQQSMLVCTREDCDAIYLGQTNGIHGGNIDTQKADALVRGAFRFYDASGGILATVREGTDWYSGAGSTTTGGGLNDAGGTYLFLSSQAQGELKSSSTSDPMKYVQVKFFIGGSFEDIHESFWVSDSGQVSAMLLPSCISANVPTADGQGGWQSTGLDFGGFEFDPVVFPEAENALSVSSLSNLTGNYIATKKPGTEEHIDDGGYDYDSFSRYISFVGHD